MNWRMREGKKGLRRVREGGTVQDIMQKINRTARTKYVGTL